MDEKAIIQELRERLTSFPEIRCTFCSGLFSADYTIAFEQEGGDLQPLLEDVREQEGEPLLEMICRECA